MNDNVKTISVDILMSTYNGEKYLRNQILSLQQQTHQNWKLLIRDDGSTDKTCEIIERFCVDDPRIQRVQDDLGNLGVAKSFFQLLHYSNADYVIFCDQDDIWLEKKLELLLAAALEHLSEGVPSFVYCDAYAYSDEGGVIVSDSVSHLHADNLREFLFFNSGYQGCSILFNRKLADMAKQYNEVFYMHDDIISLIGHAFGTVRYLPLPLMLYRQHEENVTGATSLGKWSGWYRFFRKGAAVLSRDHYEEKKVFFEKYYNDLVEENRQLFEAYLRFPEVSLLKRLSIVLLYQFSLGGMYMPLWIKTLIRKPLQ